MDTTTTSTSTTKLLYSKIINVEGIQLLEKENEIELVKQRENLHLIDGLRSRTSSISSFVSTKSINSFYDSTTTTNNTKELKSISSNTTIVTNMVSPTIVSSSSFSFLGTSSNKKHNIIKSTITKVLNVFTNLNTSQFKLLLLLLMVLQNSSTVLVGRYTRIIVTTTDSSSTTKSNELYDVGHLIMITELSKLLLSILFEYYNNCTSNTSNTNTNNTNTTLSSLYITFNTIKYYCYDTFFSNASKISIPAILYLIQNTLLYIALENLTAPLFQVTYQGKLVTTAIVSVVLLNRSYNIRQWICLLCISFGVAIVVLGEQSSSSSSTKDNNNKQQQNLFLGLTSVSIACFSSALAGVYFEMVLKKQSSNTNSNTVPSPKITPSPTTSTGSNTNVTTSTSSHNDMDADVSNDNNNDIDKRSAFSTSSSSAAIILLQQKLQSSEPSLWIRNVQLSFFTILIIVVQQFYKSFIIQSKVTDTLVTTINNKSYLYGFTIWVWILVLLQAGGGLLVAAVIKYTDNVLKGLATGVSVVVATICSTILFNTVLSNQFIFGSIMILVSVYYFNNPFPSSLIIGLNSSQYQNGISKQEKRTLLPK